MSWTRSPLARAALYRVRHDDAHPLIPVAAQCRRSVSVMVTRNPHILTSEKVSNWASHSCFVRREKLTDSAIVRA